MKKVKDKKLKNIKVIREIKLKKKMIHMRISSKKSWEKWRKIWKNERQKKWNAEQRNTKTRRKRKKKNVEIIHRNFSWELDILKWV